MNYVVKRPDIPMLAHQWFSLNGKSKRYGINVRIAGQTSRCLCNG